MRGVRAITKPPIGGRLGPVGQGFQMRTARVGYLGMNNGAPASPHFASAEGRGITGDYGDMIRITWI
jgi:hypothetical protein